MNQELPDVAEKTAPPQPVANSAADSAEGSAVNDAAATSDDASSDEPSFTINDRRFWAREAAADEEAAQTKPSYVRDLESQLAAKEARLQATLSQYKEALDEFEGAKARLRRDITKEIEAGKRALLSDLLEVVDNLERAINAAMGREASGQEALLSGVSMVRDQFLAKLQGLGVRRIDAMGQDFDPSRFEAVSTVPVSDAAQDGKIIGVIRDCYAIGEETLRYGMVAVGKQTPSDVPAA